MLKRGYRAGLRNGCTLQEFHNELGRRNVDSAIRHATWAAKQLAKHAGSSDLNMDRWIDGMLRRRYGVCLELIPFARQKFYQLTAKRIALNALSVTRKLLL